MKVKRLILTALPAIIMIMLPTAPVLAGRYFKDPKNELKKALHRDQGQFSPAIKQAEQYDQEIKKQFTFEADATTAKRPTAIVDRITDTIPNYNQYDFTTRVVRQDDANAFNTGGLYIYVFTGLLDLSKTDDSLAFVLSHEIAHTIAGHHARLQDNLMREQVLVLILGALIKNKTFNKVISTYHDYSSHKYSRNHEREADIIGAFYAYQAGYDPYAGAGFFQALYQKQGGKASEILGILSGSPLFSTHPRLRERMKRIRAVGSYLDGNILFDDLGPEVQYVLAEIVTENVRKKANLNYARKHYKPYQSILEKIRKLKEKSRQQDPE
ncbi:MAG: M48 family metallopeptidase [bacterium]|nr:M48 family metallopeptidase [bacterium]